MKYTEGRIGRIFVLRLEDSDIVPHCIEKFAMDKGISVGQVVLLGGIGKGELVVGPRDSCQMPPQKMLLPIDGAHEILAIGVIAPDKDGKSILHIHGALGRSGQTMTGCMREGLSTWLVGEAVIYEILDVDAVRLYDEESRFKLLNVGNIDRQV